MKVYKFELTEQEANIILAGLHELPYRVAISIITKLQEQANKQQESEKKD